MPHKYSCRKRRWETPLCKLWQKGVLYKGMKVIVPTAIRALMLNGVHSSHLGVVARVRLARDVLFWPGRKWRKRWHNAAPAMLSGQNNRKSWWWRTSQPSSIVSQDLFTFQNKDYLITIDYYSDFTNEWRTFMSILFQMLILFYSMYGITECNVIGI